MQNSLNKIERILNDASYLIDEMEAFLMQVEGIPITERPVGSYSILEYIGLIDYAQKSYYSEILQRTKSSKEIDIELYSLTFEADAVSNLPSEVISNFIKHRKEIVSELESTPSRKWYDEYILNNEPISLVELFEEMILNERTILKEIANRILAIDQNQNT